MKDIYEANIKELQEAKNTLLKEYKKAIKGLTEKQIYTIQSYESMTKSFDKDIEGLKEQMQMFRL